MTMTEKYLRDQILILEKQLKDETTRANANHRGWCEATGKWKKYMDETHVLRGQLEIADFQNIARMQTIEFLKIGIREIVEKSGSENGCAAGCGGLARDLLRRLKG